MASGSQNMTTYNARTVTGSSSAASPTGALLLSGAGRASDATGDTWIFLDSLGGTSTPWGIKHDQANNKIHIYGNNTDSVWTRMDTGDTYILGKVGIGYDPETSENLYKLYVNGTSLYTGRLYGNTGNGLEIQSLDTGNWKEGIRVYNASDNYSVLCLCNNDLSDLLSLVHSGSAHSYYIDIENDGTYSKINIPSKHSGTMALTDGHGASGTWDISITGSARYVQSPDTRSTNPAPSTFSAANGVSFDFKQGSVIGLTSANYSGVMSYRPYASGTDWSGGNAHQIAFNNAGLYWRQGDSSWGNWTQIVTNSGTWSISINGRLTDSAHSWTATEVYNYMTARVLKAGDTMTGQLYINYDQDVGLNQNGSLIIGTKGGGNIGIDGNEIMARSNSAASTLYLNSEGGNVYIGSGGVTSVGTITSSAGYLISTCNGNTVTIGSQNSACCHIYNSADIPFAFNCGFLMVNSGDIGSSRYPTGNIVVKSGGRISGNGGSLYLGNSGNQNWVYIQDMCSQDGQKWKIHQNGNAEFNGTVTASTFSGNATNVSGTVAVGHGGTGATTAASALTNLGAAGYSQQGWGTSVSRTLHSNCGLVIVNGYAYGIWLNGSNNIRVVNYVEGTSTAAAASVKNGAYTFARSGTSMTITVSASSNTSFVIIG